MGANHSPVLGFCVYDLLHQLPGEHKANPAAMKLIGPKTNLS